MTKSELFSLLDYQKYYKEAHYLDKAKFYEFNGRKEDVLDYKLPKIDALKNEFDILNKELTNIKEKKLNAIYFIKKHEKNISKIKCTHPIVFKNSWFMGSSYHCPFCGEKIDNLTDKIVIEGSYSHEDDEVIITYTIEELSRIMNLILKKYDDNEEVDLKKEFINQYNLGNIGSFTINNKNIDTRYEKIYNILIINGSNIIEINDAFITKSQDKEIIKNVWEIYSKFYYLYRFRTRLLTSHIEGIENNYNIIDFTTIDDLLKKIGKDINYDLIVDMTNLFTYQIIDNKIVFNKYVLQLKNMFPNSKIITINSDLQELKQKIENDDFTEDFKKLILK